MLVQTFLWYVGLVWKLTFLHDITAGIAFATVSIDLKSKNDMEEIAPQAHTRSEHER